MQPQDQPAEVGVVTTDPAEEIAELEAEATARLSEAVDLASLEEAERVAFRSKRSRFAEMYQRLGSMEPTERRQVGRLLNELRARLETLVDDLRAEFLAASRAERLAADRLDLTEVLPGRLAGHLHLVTQVREALEDVFIGMGYEIAEGPEVEAEWYNFDALNFPPDHPAREMQDTLFVAGPDGIGRSGKVLRTHTSPVQIRTMLMEEPPIRIIVPGRTFRADHDATHSPMFHQCEGLVLDRDLTLGHLKGALIDFLRTFFGIADLPVRFRSSYFPFTEPSMEVDIGWNRRTGELGKGGDWLEILGSGMVHPRVLANCGIDPREWQGFAWGMGVERIAMLKHGMTDLRPFFESDLRWLRHYGFSPLAPTMLHEGV
ncbi:MAG TPA: phenylalanine--tRNA ligase subunit alpha [Acetobacteraceae bacterium]|nr:phenylalanine--tRNA ligase subunit alpha [Acetobacteraceae bacterium]